MGNAITFTIILYCYYYTIIFTIFQVRKVWVRKLWNWQHSSQVIEPGFKLKSFRLGDATLLSSNSLFQLILKFKSLDNRQTSQYQSPLEKVKKKKKAIPGIFLSTRWQKVKLSACLPATDRRWTSALFPLYNQCFPVSTHLGSIMLSHLKSMLL